MIVPTMQASGGYMHASCR